MLRLKELRNNKGLSQAAIAERFGITQQAYANYERGTRQPDYDTLNKLADFFGVTVDYLLGRENKPANSELAKENNEQMENVIIYHRNGKTVEKQFTKEEWIDLIIRSTGMECSCFDDRIKWHMLARIAPMIESNMNICELGPRSTGKSHIYKEISPYVPH